MVAEKLARRAGQIGIVASLFLWLVSLPVLGLAMQANQAAWRGNAYRVVGVNEIRWLHGIAVIWSLVFVLLQLMAPLLLAFTMRAFYRFRSAVCFSISAGCAFMLDALGLLALLVWLRFRLGAG